MRTVTLLIPKVLAKKAEKEGMDLESLILELLIEKLDLDPGDVSKIHADLAEKFLKEGEEVIDEDPVQASEKLYKAAEECVKALTYHFNFEDIIGEVKGRGRWTVTSLEKAVEKISDNIGAWFEEAWDRANYLRVWGFHEAKLDVGAVRRRVSHVERMVSETLRIIRGSRRE